MPSPGKALPPAPRPHRDALTVVSVAYPFAPVGAHAVGGAEEILTAVDQALAEGGHRSLVVARQGSTTSGQIISTEIPEGIITPEMRGLVVQRHQASLDRALASAPVDLVHFHGIDFAEYTVPPEVPVLVTLHMPPSWYPETIWHLPSNVHLQCVSQTQRCACPAAAESRLLLIENGVPAGAPLGNQARSSALMLSRICPEKNLHVGLDAARLAGVPALLAGETFPYAEHLRYLHEQIEPRLGANARLLGPVGGARKRALLAEARCVLLPTLAPETSSLVAMEAAAAGTPVIAFPSGALAEIVQHGETGFLVDSMDAMARAIAHTGQIDPRRCQAVAQQRFSLERMTAAYLALYDRLLTEPTPA